MNVELPEFYKYTEEDGRKVDCGFEAIQDFNLRWILQCAEDRYQITNRILYEYANLTAFFLIHGFNQEDGQYSLNRILSEDFKISHVKTRRQFNGIDLIAEVNVLENSLSKKYVLNIENKWYTKIPDGQLEYYRNEIEKEYNSDETIINLCIFCDHENLDEVQKQRCQNNNYKFLAISDIQELMKNGKTNNALFDEYWFRF
ncbi:MAG: PD-(D/E)XK nuclease family protein [Bacteroidetes bacterium]|nr:PD-(D/E)XK nuclease family protein [Bacteroidota bacterium]